MRRLRFNALQHMRLLVIEEDGAEGETMVRINSYDVIVLDRMLPHKDGLDVLRDLRRDGIATPILLLTALDAVDEKVRGLGLGADDYLTKPFALAELGARWLDQANPARCGEMLAVISELEVLLDRLSLLARADAGRLVIHPEPVEPAALLGAAIGRFQTVAAARNLRLVSDAGPQTFLADPVLLTTILNNLLGNATSHAPAGSTIRVHLDKDGLMVENPAPDLTESDIPLLFERIWRKDSSHSGDGHSGLGLSIVQACAKVLGDTCVAELGGDGCLRVRIGLRPGVSR